MISTQEAIAQAAEANGWTDRTMVPGIIHLERGDTTIRINLNARGAIRQVTTGDLLLKASDPGKLAVVLEWLAEAPEVAPAVQITADDALAAFDGASALPTPIGQDKGVTGHAATTVNGVDFHISRVSMPDGSVRLFATYYNGYGDGGTVSRSFGCAWSPATVTGRGCSPECGQYCATLHTAEAPVAAEVALLTTLGAELDKAEAKAAARPECTDRRGHDLRPIGTTKDVDGTFTTLHECEHCGIVRKEHLRADGSLISRNATYPAAYPILFSPISTDVACRVCFRPFGEPCSEGCEGYTLRCREAGTDGQRWFNLDDLADALNARGLTAYVEQTGGGTATLQAGQVYLDHEGDERHHVIVGPGWFEGPNFTMPYATPDELYCGHDDGGMTRALDLADYRTVEAATEAILAWAKDNPAPTGWQRLAEVKGLDDGGRVRAEVLYHPHGTVTFREWPGMAQWECQDVSHALAMLAVWSFCEAQGRQAVEPYGQIHELAGEWLRTVTVPEVTE